MAKFIERVYVFNYGGPLFLVSINEGSVHIRTNLGDEKIVRGMAIVADLIRRYSNQKIFVRTPYVGFFSNNYIVVTKVTRERFIGPAIGFTKRVANELDKLGDVPTNYLIKEILKHLPDKEKYKVILE